MNQLFYNQFGMAELKFIFLCGDVSREMVCNILAREIAGQNLKAIVFSNGPLKYPMEGQILVDIDAELFFDELKTAEANTIYLCSAIENDLLLPPSEKLLNNILQMEIPEARFLIQSQGPVEESLLKRMTKEQHATACMITSLNFSNLEEKLERFLSAFKSEHLFSDDLIEHWQNIIKPYCVPQFTTKNENGLKTILFINQVKSLIDENTMMGLFRNLRHLYDKIYLGNINDFKIKEI